MIARRSVTVMEGERFVETSDCRVVQLHDGRVGVVWRGVAFPLESGDRVDVSAEGVPPSAAVPPTPPVVARPYAVLPGDEEGWLLVAGPASVRDIAIAQLKASGVMILRHGRWLGDPVDDLDADWFVRFVRPLDGTDVDVFLARCLNLPTKPVTETTRSHLLDLELAASRAREASLRGEIAKLEEKLLRLDAAPSNAVLEVQHAFEAERTRRLDAENALAAALETSQSSSLPVAPAVVPVTREVQKASRRLLAEVEAVFDMLLPSVRILRDSLTVAAGEFRDRRSLYRCLAELAPTAGRPPAGWKKLQGVDAWWERHVSNGDDDAGRIYGRFDPSGRAWDILLSHKGQQGRDISWLQRN